MNIGAQLYTVRDYCQTPENFDTTLKKIADIGYRSIQISAVGDIGTDKIKSTADKYGLEIILTHTPPQRILSETDKVIEEHRYMGAKYIGLGSMTAKYKSSKQAIMTFISDFLPAAEKIFNSGLKFMYHNHDFEFEKFEDKTIMEYLIDGFTSELMGFTLDVFWVQASGGDPAYWLKKLKGRVDTIHFKDMAIVEGKRVMSEVMEGNMNWDAIYDACAFSGVRWAFIEQDDCYGKNPFDCLKISYDNIKKYCK